MKIYHSILALLFTSLVTAQIEVKFSTYSGYERNINRAPTILDNGDDILEKEDLYMNSMYQDAIVSFKFLKTWKKSSLTAYLTPEVRYYFSEFDASQTILNSKIYYKYSFKKNLRWDSSFQYKIKDREGENLDQNELNLPFGYKLFTLNSGLRYRLFKNNRSYTKLVLGNKKFDNSASRSVAYRFYGIETEFKNIQWKNHLLHSYGVELGYSKRDYSITNFSDNSNGDRNWNYLDASVFYRLPFSKKMYIEPRVSYQQREDKTNSIFGYHQIRPEVLFRFQTKKWDYKMNINYSFRRFDNLTAENEDEDPIGNLTYQYLRIRSSLEYEFKENLNFLVDLSILDRTSNNTNITTTAFRSYSNNYVGIGLRYNF